MTTISPRMHTYAFVLLIPPATGDVHCPTEMD
jgi:hypothetical protein